MPVLGPHFSVVVPTFGRPKALSECLRAMAALDYPSAEFEVLVVDDGSPEPVRSLAREFESALRLRVVEQPNAGPATARNAGAAHARGRYLAFTDDDCAPDRDWLRALHARFDATPTAAIGGRTLNALPADPYSAASQMLVEYLYQYYHVEGAKGRFFTTSNLAVPRDRFTAIGGFDTSFPRAAAEDREFSERWMAHGFELIYAEEVLVRHAHALTLPAFWRQHFGYGRGAVFLHNARARRGNGEIRLEPLRFYANLVGYPLRQGMTAGRLRAALLMLLSQVAYGSGYYWERFRQWSTASSSG